jgi:RNA polymerase sigma factor (TIGR02999 family)
MDSDSKSITRLLSDWNAGDSAAGREIVELVYNELRRLAAHYLRDERKDHTLQPTALVHELYLKLFANEPVDYKDKGHFLAVASRQLRRIIVDYARTQGAQKRWGNQARVSLESSGARYEDFDVELVDLDQALDRLSQLDARAAQIVEMRYFGGLTEDEVAEMLNISRTTVKRDWEFARTWLLKELA